MMKPSETPRGTAWISQFEIDDREAAARLLDAVRFVSSGELLDGIRGELTQFLKENPGGLPAALVPVMSEEDMQPLHGKTLRSDPTVFVDFDPSQHLSGDPGSEAFVAQLIREVRKGAEFRGQIAKFPISAETFKLEKIRALVCVTDYVGSGRQVQTYVNAWHRHTSIRSWRSLGWLKIYVVAFAATQGGLTLLEQHPHIDGVRVVEIARSLGDQKDPLEDPKVAAICRLYAHRGKLKGDAIGYRGTGGLFASSLSVPNNLPAILVRYSKNWTPFFDGRSAPMELIKELGDFRPPVKLSAGLSRHDEPNKPVPPTRNQAHSRWEPWITLLSMMPRSEAKLASATGWPLAEVSAITQTLRELGLTDDDGTRTPSGDAAISNYKRRRHSVTARLQADTSPYYAWQKG